MIKSEVSTTKKGGVKFPCLMVSDESNMVILAEGYSSGNSYGGVVVAKGSSDWEVGYQNSNWAKSCFTKFNGSVTLTNED